MMLEPCLLQPCFHVAGAYAASKRQARSPKQRYTRSNLVFRLYHFTLFYVCCFICWNIDNIFICYSTHVMRCCAARSYYSKSFNRKGHPLMVIGISNGDIVGRRFVGRSCNPANDLVLQKPVFLYVCILLRRGVYIIIIITIIIIIYIYIYIYIHTQFVHRPVARASPTAAALYSIYIISNIIYIHLYYIYIRSIFDLYYIKYSFSYYI